MNSENRDYINALFLKHKCNERISIKKNEFLFQEGEEDSHVYLLVEGNVKIQKNKWVLWSAKSHELIGISSYFSEKTTYEFSVKAKQDSTFYKIANKNFEMLLLEDPKFSRIIMEMLCERIKRTNKRTKSLLEEPSKYRLINELISRTKELNASLIPCTLEDLSGVVGVSVRLIRNMITELEQKKLVERTKGSIIIHDLRGLEIIAKSN